MSKPNYQSPFGGHLLKNSNAKAARPLSGSSLVRIVLKARATDSIWGKNIRTRIFNITKTTAQKHRVHVKELSWKRNHLSLVVRLSRIKRYAPFIRALSGTIALQLTRANKYKALVQSFWQGRPWTCICGVLKQTYQIKETLLKKLFSIHIESLESYQKARAP